MPTPARVLVAGYAWIVTLALGATFADVVAFSSAGAGSVTPGEVSDALLGLTAIELLVGLAAIVSAGANRPTWLLLIASVAVVVAGLFTPALLSGLVGTGEASGFRVGPWLRLGEGGTASIVAFAALGAAWRDVPRS